nr:hypothetical transcript [Hymenolepis microstoma]
MFDHLNDQYHYNNRRGKIKVVCAAALKRNRTFQPAWPALSFSSLRVPEELVLSTGESILITCDLSQDRIKTCAKNNKSLLVHSGDITEFAAGRIPWETPWAFQFSPR